MAFSIVDIISRGILHDPDIYPNPFDFDPARYLSHTAEQPSTVTRTNPDPRAFVFGYGRRICPGRHLAEDSLFITAATILSVFNILPCIDDDGNPLKTQVEYTGGTIRSVDLDNNIYVEVELTAR